MRSKDNLKKPTIADRIKCNDIAEVVMHPDGSMTVRHTFRALVEWAKVGLEATDDDLSTLSDAEIKEIGEKVKAMSEVPLGKE